VVVGVASAGGRTFPTPVGASWCQLAVGSSEHIKTSCQQLAMIGVSSTVSAMRRQIDRCTQLVFDLTNRREGRYALLVFSCEKLRKKAALLVLKNEEEIISKLILKFVLNSKTKAYALNNYVW